MAAHKIKRVVTPVSTAERERRVLDIVESGAFEGTFLYRRIETNGTSDSMRKDSRKSIATNTFTRAARKCCKSCSCGEPQR